MYARLAKSGRLRFDPATTVFPQDRIGGQKFKIKISINHQYHLLCSNIPFYYSF